MVARVTPAEKRAALTVEALSPPTQVRIVIGKPHVFSWSRGQALSLGPGAYSRWQRWWLRLAFWKPKLYVSHVDYEKGEITVEAKR